MALSFTRPSPEDTSPLYTAPCRLYLTADDRVVGEGNTDALSLLVRAGGTMPLADAVRYGLIAAPVLVEPESAHEALEDSFRPGPEA